MRVLVTGSRGYLGSVLSNVLRARGHSVTGWDAGYFDPVGRGAAVRDIRDIRPDDLLGFDAVVHLAALCNDACGALDAGATHEINGRAAGNLARVARCTGVERLVLASSCSIYGAAAADGLDENAAVNPLTAYARSKVDAEAAIRSLSGGTFCPTALRFATLYGLSSSFRSDLLVNRMVSCAWRWDTVSVHGEGRAARPLLHVRDAATAIAECLAADGATVQGKAFNVGREDENYEVREVAELVRQRRPTARVRAVGTNDDRRSYRVRFDAFRQAFPGWRPSMTVPVGITELEDALDAVQVDGQHEWRDGWGRSDRSRWLQRLCGEGTMSQSFRWTPTEAARGVRV
ncbi:NAD(P)-dependent oxidoreductase [Streptomyces sp. GESEQ-4]|uniref:NAD-dependent epimerase/dehydratase family protein n=1 Tax=Streptomyces sp. GESEQ-4 TaxID=2812655 RepID=UPI001B3404B7|nr:SDR family oxidoreductase [Streptomyces sp. GESEQ-4]